ILRGRPARARIRPQMAAQGRHQRHRRGQRAPARGQHARRSGDEPCHDELRRARRRLRTVVAAARTPRRRAERDRGATHGVSTRVIYWRRRWLFPDAERRIAWKDAVAFLCSSFRRLSTAEPVRPESSPLLRELTQVHGFVAIAKTTKTLDSG